MQHLVWLVGVLLPFIWITFPRLDRSCFQSPLVPLVHKEQAALRHTAVKHKNPTPLPVFTASNFARTGETFVGKCYKSSTARENYKLGPLVNSLVICEIQS